jgi:hypothetical protein
MLRIPVSKRRTSSSQATPGLSPKLASSWPPITRRQFEALLQPEGALLVGNPRTVADKALSVSAALGGIERLSFQMSIASLPHGKRMRAIELLGTDIAPAVRDHSNAISAMKG